MKTENQSDIKDPLRHAIRIGRVWMPTAEGSAVICVRDGEVYDITSRDCPSVADLCEMNNPVDYVNSTQGICLGKEIDISGADVEDDQKIHLLAPCDLQSIKACGVTFAKSMVERLIEERAQGDINEASKIRNKIGDHISQSLSDIKPGSKEADAVKEVLIAEGLWSQYLEVGIGPFAEVFSKAQVLSAVGDGARIGLHPASGWNNPEPEIVLAVSSQGKIIGATLGNDVNLRDIEGRSALLLGKAKDNNASCAIGPYIRLFDEHFTLDDVRQAELKLVVTGEDGYRLEGYSSMQQISRDPTDLVNQTIGRHHQYPDGLMLFLGTLFAPTDDRDEPGKGFTHKIGDRVSISSPILGELQNTVDLSTNCPPWEIGPRAFMKNLADRDLI